MASRKKDLAHTLEETLTKIQRLKSEVGKVIVGQDRMITRLLIGLFTNGHVLLEGVPGLAKTLTISTLADALQLQFQRIQFTPDLLPADLIGTMIFNQQTAEFEVKQGPIFANLILADEINRSPAKVQSALLEAMQEKQVTIGPHTFTLDKPFWVLATQNPIDQEGTYPLPEAQIDRFMMKVYVDYPNKAEEKAIMRRMAKTNLNHQITAILSQQEIFDIRKLVDSIRLSEPLEDYIVDLVIASREPVSYGITSLTDYIAFGASPRATRALNLASRAYALLEGRTYVLPEDIKAIAHDVLNHRLILNYEAEADEVSPQDCIETILQHVPIGG